MHTAAENAALNRERNRDRQRFLRETKPDEVKAYTRAYYLANKEARKKYTRDYAKKNPEKMACYGAKRRAQQADAPICDLVAVAKWRSETRKKRRLTCYWCGKSVSGRNCHFDHVIPLSKGGSESLENYCVSCPKCNLSKHTTMPEEFNERSKTPRLFV